MDRGENRGSGRVITSAFWTFPGLVPTIAKRHTFIFVDRQHAGEGGNLRNSEAIGPSLADVLAFTLLESAEDVARVERSAANRMAAVRGWVGWRVVAVEMEPDDDDLHRLKVFCGPLGGRYRELMVLQFLVSTSTKRRSQRFESFLAACGIKAINDSDEIEGRYFATRNRGRGVGDFGPLTLALPQ
ncbi:hypothetical protein [Rhizobium leucaenae]|uniref:hypothetical protein n=1 Tax=Rhizobium leucaenae TaxID=29450 RepID=UPI001610CAEE|nr:hypothetical protein [Rhizobium leucaenae]MBB6304028.1 hypothetical protein [Rhizobium leucaenae]